jgi:hypothetical protein
VKPEKRILKPQQIRVLGLSLSKTLETEKKIFVVFSFVNEGTLFRCLPPFEIEIE